MGIYSPIDPIEMNRRPLSLMIRKVPKHMDTALPSNQSR